jgi:excisionase family DNA binding protein
VENLMAHARRKVEIEPLLLDVDQAAAVLNDGVGHIRHLAEIGELEAIRDGRRFRITMASCKRRVEKLLASTQPSEPLVATPNGAKCVERKRRAKAVTA